METSIISEGTTLLVLGMGFVFLFLGLLIVAMSVMSYLVERFSSPEPVVSPSIPDANSAAQIDPNVLAAIRAALTQHREKN